MLAHMIFPGISRACCRFAFGGVHSKPNTSYVQNYPPTALSPSCPPTLAAHTNLDVEGAFPPFVLEVVSPASVERDEEDKLRAYDSLGAREYVLFTPRENDQSTLIGYRRAADGKMTQWPSEADGSLRSDVLGLRLVVRGKLLRAQTFEGELLRTLQEAEEEVLRAQTAEGEILRTLQKAEDEVLRLRQQLERLQSERD